MLNQAILNATQKSVVHNTQQSAELRSIQARFTTASKLIAQYAQKYLTEINQSNSSKLILHSATIFSKELHSPSATTDHLNTLDNATTFGWIAYTVFDHIWDREGREDELAVGTISLRESYKLFRTAVNTKSWYQLVDHTFDSIDAGFTWEMRSARFDINQPLSNIQLPQYPELEQQFVQRSIGLSLPLLALLDHQQTKIIEAALKYYYYFIAIKQINDDAHDWHGDLMTGKINLVNWHLITLLKHNHKHIQSQLSINQLAQQELLAKTIWEDIIPLTMSAAIDYYAQAQQHLETLQPYMQTSLLNSIIDKQRQVAQHTLDQRRLAKDFLNSYTI